MAKKGHKKKHRIRTLFLLLIICAAALAGYIAYIFAYKGNIEPETTATATTTESAVYDLPTFKRHLKHYAGLYEVAIVAQEQEPESGTYAIPGLGATETLTGNQEGKSAMCTSMTPQGIAVTEKYLFISAYCHTKQHNSVIYVMDKETHEFTKELILPNKNHVGSLAYDDEFDNLWVCGSKKGTAQVNAIAIETIESYRLQKEYKPIEFLHVNNVLEIPKSSFMTYFNSHLYVGYFTKEEDGVIKKYKVEDSGNIRKASFTYEDMQSETGVAIDEAKISPLSQGMTFYADIMFLSHSMGVLPSRLVAFENRDDVHDFTDELALENVTLPNMVEQICMYGDTLYFIFESGGYAYRELPGIAMDRVIKIDLGLE